MCVLNLKNRVTVKALIGVLLIVMALCVGAPNVWAVHIYKNGISFEDSLNENSTEETKDEHEEGDASFNPARIPEEVWLRILQYLDLADLGRLARVNSFFLRVIEDEALLGPRNAWSYYGRFIDLPNRNETTLGLELSVIVETFNGSDSYLSDQGFLYLLKKLLALGAAVGAVDNFGLTALHKAAKNDNEEALRTLLDYKANVEALNNHGETPLHWAAMYANESVTLLLDRNANAGVVDNLGRTPLHWAAIYGNEAAILLLEGDANVGLLDNNGQTPLHLAVRSVCEGAAILLLERNANVDAVDNWNETPLHLAARIGNEGIMRVLLDRNADVGAFNLLDQTPLRLAELYEHQDILPILQEYPANANAVGAGAQTPLDQTMQDQIEEPTRRLSENLNPRTWTREQLFAILTLVGAFTYTTGCNLL